MEPTSPSAGASPEMAHRQQSEFATAPENPLHSGESLPSAEAAKNASGSAEPAAVPLSGPLPQLPAPQEPPSATTQAPTTTPLVAADDDLIEREWIQKAKQIVKQTKDDPHTQEKEVSKLQADYIKKRYGKEVKVMGEQA